MTEEESVFICVHRIIRGKNGEDDAAAESWINTDNLLSIEQGSKHPGTRLIMRDHYLRVTESAGEILARIRGSEEN